MNKIDLVSAMIDVFAVEVTPKCLKVLFREAVIEWIKGSFWGFLTDCVGVLYLKFVQNLCKL